MTKAVSAGRPLRFFRPETPAEVGPSVNIRRFHDINLKWKLLVPFLSLALTGTLALFVVSYRFQDSLIHVNEATRLRNQYRFFLNDIEVKRDMAMSLAWAVARNPEVAEAFARRDRQRLLTLLMPVYDTLHTDYGVKQFHFHVPPAASFLRLHAPEQYGDELESYRFTINKARTTGRGVGGIEKGVFGFGIRSVVPVFYREAQVGTVEIGLSLEQPLLEEFKRHFGADLLLYMVDDAQAPVPPVYAATMDRGLLSAEFFGRVRGSGEEILVSGRLGERNMASIAGPVRDFSGRIVAVVEISVDRRPTLALLKRYGMIALLVGAVALTLSVIFVWSVSVIFTGRINEVVKGAEDIASGRRDTGILVESGDELGEMARSINRMLVSLETSRDQLCEYSHNLEDMVEQRTRSLRESEQTYRTLVENVPLIVYMISAEGRVVFLNRAVELMLGATPEELSGHHRLWDLYIHPDDRPRVVSMRHECLREGKDLHVDYRMIHKDRHTVYGVDHAVAVYDEHRRLVRMDGIVVDVTTQKELQEKILQSEELETLSQISARLAHEVRNPLTAIGGLTRRLLKSFEGDDPRTQKGEMIVEQVEKLERILKMMLAYIGPRQLNLAPVDLNQIVRRSVESVEQEFAHRDFTIKAYLDEGLGRIWLDSEQIEKVLTNLMENAFHRMGRQGRLKVATREIGEHATVTLSYQVPFISDDDIKDFFYPFAVAYPFAKGRENGDIMDVPIAKVVIHNHGGIINVSKEEGNIVWIDISFPLSSAPPAT